MEVAAPEVGSFRLTEFARLDPTERRRVDEEVEIHRASDAVCQDGGTSVAKVCRIDRYAQSSF
jgi:hypothetical protein